MICEPFLKVPINPTIKQFYETINHELKGSARNLRRLNVFRVYEHQENKVTRWAGWQAQIGSGPGWLRLKYGCGPKWLNTHITIMVGDRILTLSIHS